MEEFAKSIASRGQRSYFVGGWSRIPNPTEVIRVPLQPFRANSVRTPQTWQVATCHIFFSSIFSIHFTLDARYLWANDRVTKINNIKS